MLITFNLFENNTSWNATIHQLNSDILKRHVLTKGKVNDRNLNFSYCEASSMGSITDKDDIQLGEFIVFS
ncbi:hypothetical protein [Vibrio renipiscarius]|uniref:Uncharacterized protein n=1 Tax=Vibrio renipiscarius TaxID=1461322 RepID=A0A0C2JSG5_9VIBR|nr:hypothetical protein [Vibrio renipiscarius]KII79383.1 hypothetical protein PL18_06820 [Vibrio renipiscarius]KII80989.1 hypothetical protein OJ16_06845 [Vibrio renipiscarius]